MHFIVFDDDMADFLHYYYSILALQKVSGENWITFPCENTLKTIIKQSWVAKGFYCRHLALEIYLLISLTKDLHSCLLLLLGFYVNLSLIFTGLGLKLNLGPRLNARPRVKIQVLDLGLGFSSKESIIKTGITSSTKLL